MATEIWVVRIEFLRIQSFLFAVPQLRVMAGANIALGELMRKGLPDLVKDVGGLELARFPEAIEGDPIGSSGQDYRLDSPAAAAKLGVISRDGGHFYAAFASAEKAEAFAVRAAGLIRAEAPGLEFEVAPVEEVGGERPRERGRVAEVHLPEIPAMVRCQASGQGAASTYQTGGLAVGAEVARYSEKGVGRNRAAGQDLCGRFRRAIERREQREGAGLRWGDELTELCGGKYLAVITADGNGIGKRFKEFVGRTTDRTAAEMAQSEGFYHRMRVGVRRAVADAAQEVFGSAVTSGVRPYEFLMLGGDDLLLVCRADLALPFVQKYAKALTGQTPPEGPGGKPVGIGAGVVIAPPNVPMHHLVHLAEELAGGAKRLARAHDGKSAVDWMVFRESWGGEVYAERRKQALLQRGTEQWALTGRPYLVLKRDAPDGTTLESLLDSPIDDEKLVRSQRRALVEALARGRWQGELAVAELAGPARKELSKIGALHGESPWRSVGNHHVTTIPDRVELAEIPRLNTRRGEA